MTDAVYEIDWDRLVDRSLVSELAAAAGVNPPPALATVRPVLARILETSGGWPYTTVKPTLAKQRAFALRILGEAFSQTLGPTGAPMPGFTLATARYGMRAIELAPRVDVNRASAADLAAVAGLSSRRAEEIIAERLRGGAFRGLADLSERVAGIGPALARRLAPYLGFAPAGAPRGGSSGNLATDLAALVAQEPGDSVAARFARVLDRVAMHVAANPHPHTRHQLPRSVTVAAPPATVDAGRIRVLSGRRYYYLLRAAIGRAQRRIDVVMFHIALPRRDHPTLRLLEALAAARARGVRVRVLTDRDRVDDPYHSVVINAAAIRFLLDEGVNVRVDAPGRLLHSKMIVIDSEQTIIGSHNWSAGSYFSFDDLSVDVISPRFARQARQRFDSLWRRADRASATGPSS
jgi:hypothetical protein